MQLRLIELARAGWGGALLFAPRVVLNRVHHVEVDTKSVLVARVLGARHLTQAALSGINPSPEVLAMGVWVDVAHASTAVALAVVDRTRARAGLADAAVAGLWAGVGWRDLRTAPPAHDRRRDALARRVLSMAPGGSRLARIADHDRQRTTAQRSLGNNRPNRLEPDHAMADIIELIYEPSAPRAPRTANTSTRKNAKQCLTSSRAPRLSSGATWPWPGCASTTSHAGGENVHTVDKDPDTYIAEHT